MGAFSCHGNKSKCRNEMTNRSERNPAGGAGGGGGWGEQSVGEPGQNSKQTTITKNGNQCATRSLRRLNPFCAFHIHCVGTKPCANKAPARCIQPHGVRRPSAFTAALGRRRLSPPQPHATCKDGATAYLGLTCCTTNACLICDEIRRMCDEFPTIF